MMFLARRHSFWGGIGSLALVCGFCAPEKAVSRGPTPPASQLQDAKNDYFKLDLAAARAGFERVLAQGGEREDQAEAARRLALISWRFDRDWERSTSYLNQARRLEKEPFPRLVGILRMLENRGRTKEAIEAAHQAFSGAGRREDRVEAATHLGRLVWMDRGARVQTSGQVPVEVTGALGLLEPLLQTDRGRLETSRVTLGLALLADNGPLALDAWRSYYWVPTHSGSGEPAQAGHSIPETWDYPRLSPALGILSGELNGWTGGSAPPKSRMAVVEALAQSRFFAEAAWVATDPRINPAQRIDDQPIAVQVVAYAEFLERVGQIAREYYRRRALGQGANGELRREVFEAGRDLWQRLHWKAKAPGFTEGRLLRELEDRFGTYVYFQTHGNLRSMNLGHRILDETRSVEQYGRQAQVRLIVLDSMISNGYTSWFWDGAAASGGWVDRDGSIVQVRPSYADGPLRAFNRLTDSRQRQRQAEEIEEKTAADEGIARANPHAFLPGLSLRLRRQAGERLLAQLRARGLTGPALQSAFVNELNRRTWASSIFAHEGRHALDFRDPLKNMFRSGADKEFRAKLSEVALAPDPRLALTGGILAANIGDSSSHGQANLRIMRGLVEWMSRERQEIQGLDASRPLLPQLDLLSDDQLRRAFRSMDPWAQ